MADPIYDNDRVESCGLSLAYCAPKRCGRYNEELDDAFAEKPGGKENINRERDSHMPELNRFWNGDSFPRA